MTDCPNAEIRDQLPDLLHERLSPSARAVVIAHIDACADCRDEVELLRGVHVMLSARAPQVDVAAIIAALPKPPASGATPARPGRARRSWSDWRIAATVTLLVAGSSSVVIYSRVGSPAAHGVASIVDTGALTGTPKANSILTTPSVGPTSAAAPSSGAALATSEQIASAGLGMSGRLSDLDDRQLEALLNEIDRLEAVPMTEPDPVSIRIEPGNAAPSNERGGE